ncbi:hypothetical protein AVEN_139365-1, partial [Araneus ventricosus]
MPGEGKPTFCGIVHWISFFSAREIVMCSKIEAMKLVRSENSVSRRISDLLIEYTVRSSDESRRSRCYSTGMTEQKKRIPKELE